MHWKGKGYENEGIAADIHKKQDYDVYDDDKMRQKYHAGVLRIFSKDMRNACVVNETLNVISILLSWQ